MSELANNKSIRKEVQDLGETLGITPNGKTNQQKIRSIGEQASDGTYATKEYVNTLMSGALKRTIVTTLPVEDIDTNTIYMVLDSTSTQQGNVYNEYLYINNAWELIGTTEVAETVIANPTLAGTEANLTGLQVGDTKYKVPSGSGNADHITLVNGATEVTEEQIEFLLNNKGAYILYGDTPYYNVQWNGASLGYVTQLNCHNNGESFYVNVLLISAKNLSITQETYTTATSGGSTLYQHNILVEEFVQAQVLTTSATPFTLATFIQWLGNNQYPCNGMAHSMSEDGIYGSALYLFVDNNLLSTYLYDKPDSGNTWNYNFNDNVDLVFDDTVIQIQ